MYQRAVGPCQAMPLCCPLIRKYKVVLEFFTPRQVAKSHPPDCRNPLVLLTREWRSRRGNTARGASTLPPILHVLFLYRACSQPPKCYFQRPFTLGRWLGDFFRMGSRWIERGGMSHDTSLSSLCGISISCDVSMMEINCTFSISIGFGGHNFLSSFVGN
jgi:hypothetical protein